jgi:hypothetical protein
VNKVLSDALPTLQASINAALHGMDSISIRVLTLTLNVGPFDDCNIYDLTSITTSFAAGAGLLVDAPFDIECNAPYTLVEFPHITIARGTMSLTNKDGAHIDTASSITSDGAHVVVGSEKVDVTFVPLIRFSGLVGSLLSIVIKAFQPVIKFAVDEAITIALTKAIAKLNSAVLQKLPLQISLGEAVGLDTGFPYATTAADSMTLGLDGSFQPFGEALAAKANPFDVAPPLADVAAAAAADFQFAIADYSFLTLLYSLQVEGALYLVIPAELLPLTTTLLAPVAPKMASAYPGAPVQLTLFANDIDSSAYATQDNQAAVRLPVSMTFNPVVAGSLEPGFTIAVDADLSLGLSVAPHVPTVNETATQVLVGEVAVLALSDGAVVASDVGVVNVNLLVSVVNSAFAVAVAVANKRLAIGFGLPLLLENTSIQMVNASTRVATNFNLAAAVAAFTSVDAAPV